MEAINISGKNIEEIKTKFFQAGPSASGANLAIVFCSIQQDRSSIINFFTGQNIDVFGATTAGEIIDNEVIENSIVVMLWNLPKDYYRIFFKESADTRMASYEMAAFAKAHFNDPSIIVISSGLTIDAEQIINGVTDFDKSIPLFGGLAGDDLTMKGSYVFCRDHESSVGIIGLIIDNEKVNVKGIATSGWDNIGIEKTITKSNGNVVYSIDNDPAVDVFVRFFQFTESIDNTEEIIAQNFAQYPLQLTKENGNTVLRAPLMVDITSRALIFAGGIPQGSKVKFSVQPGFDLIDKTTERVRTIQPTIPEADALIMFSCKARHMALGPMTGDEAAMIRDIWKKPLIGFFTYGEIGTAIDSTCEFHNETCSMVVIREK